MNKPDLIVTQIKHCDYPLWRAMVTKHRDFFGKIIIYFNENNRFPYLDHFMQTAMAEWGDVVFLDQAEMSWGIDDWRNISTNEMLKYSTSEWVCSIEQDWFSKDWDRLLEIVNGAMLYHDLVGWYSQAGSGGGYIHPSFWFIKRAVLDQTRKDFSANNGEDHFGHISQDAKRLGAKIFDIAQDGGLNCDVGPDADCFHLGGVNQNYLEGLKPEFEFHRPIPFMVYNYECRQQDIPQDPRFLGISQDIEHKLHSVVNALDLRDNEWSKFFKI